MVSTSRSGSGRPKPAAPRNGHEEDHRVITTPRRLGALALLASIALTACSSTGASTAPSAAAPTTAPTMAASAAPSTADASPSSAASAAPENKATCVAGSITAGGSTALQPLVDKVGK